MAARQGGDMRYNASLGVPTAAPYGYAQYEAGNDRAYQNYPPLHNQSNPSFYSSQSNLTTKKDVDTMVSERYISRTPSPTPSEQDFLNRKGVIDWQKIKNWRFWIRREWLWYYVIGGIILVVTILISVYDRQIVKALQGPATTIKDLPAGWLIPIGIFFIISFPPLFGHEILAILCGVVWGLWIGFAITAAGTFIGELGNFYAFRYCCRARGEKYERTKLLYGALAKVVRDGGFKIALIARYSAIPGHFTTAVFSTCGMGIFTFAAAAFLSLPKQFVTVYIGVIIEESGLGTESTKDKLISYTVVAITGVITYVAMWYIYREIEKVKGDIVYKRRKGRQAKLMRSDGFSRSGSTVAFNPRQSESDLPLNPGESTQYQRWDANGQAVGVSGDPSLVRAPQPHRALSANAVRVSPGDDASDNSYSTARTSPVQFDAPTAMGSRVAYTVQRQESTDTVNWDTSAHGTDVYRLPTIKPSTPLSGNFARTESPNNPFRQQQQQQPMTAPITGFNQGHAVMSPVATDGPIPPPLAPPPSATGPSFVPNPHDFSKYSSQPTSPVPSAPYTATSNTAYPFPQAQFATNSYPISAPLSPQQTPRQQTFPPQVQGIGSHPVSPVHATAVNGFDPPTGPPPSFTSAAPPYTAYVSPSGGPHAQMSSDESTYYTPPHSRVPTEQFDPLPSPGSNTNPYYSHPPS